ncbi:MAG: NYN domain-containing protein [Phycisphaeraceae bacterium]|nr:NYN domain-containing protein [Phycisphaeraceae bacterium]
MSLIVDCYNLLHHDMPPELAGLEEEGLCQLLAKSRWRGQRMAVVCDGVAKPGGLTQSPVLEVELVYSGRKRSADDVIVEEIARDSAPRRLWVVSDDRQIQKAARRRRAKVLSCGEMVKELLEAKSGGGKGAKGSGKSQRRLDDSEVARWVERFGFGEEEDGGKKEEGDEWGVT